MSKKQQLIDFIRNGGVTADGKKKVVLCCVGASGNGKSKISVLFRKLMVDNKVAPVGIFSFGTKLKEFSSEVFNIPIKYFYDSNLKDSKLSEPLLRYDIISAKLKLDLTPRQILCILGSGMRSILPTYWIDRLIEQVKQSELKITIIDDCRHENEIEAIHSQFDDDCLVLTMYVTKFLSSDSDSSADSGDSGDATHESEKMAQTHKQHSDLVFNNCKPMDQITSIDQFFDLVVSN